MSGKLSRFLKLERTRKEGPAAGASTGNAASSRFDALESAREAPAAAVTPVVSARFTAGPAEPQLEVHLSGAEDQPFVRCARCEADNSAFAAHCTHCGQDLHTPEQRDFNEKLWAQRRGEAAREKEALEALRRGRAQAQAEEADARRKLGVALATQVELETRRRLDQEDLRDGLGWGHRWGHRWGYNDLEARLWEKLPVAGRQAAIVLFVAVPLLLLLFRGTRPFGSLMLFVAFTIYLRIRIGRW